MQCITYCLFCDCFPAAAAGCPSPSQNSRSPRLCQVEDLKARSDVTVIKITKDTRDQAAEQVYQVTHPAAPPHTSSGPPLPPLCS